MTKKILSRVLVIAAGIFTLFLTNSLYSQCKVIACNCCEEEQYYQVLDSVNNVIGTFSLQPNECSGPIGGLSWPEGATYRFVLDEQHCPQDNPISVYVTGCVCRLEPLDTIWLPCCNVSEKRSDKSNLDLKNFKLYQNYPNPFNPSTTINFDLPEDSFVTLTIYDITGKVILQPISNSLLKRGFHDYILNTKDKDLSSGIYFYKLIAGSYVDEKKMVLIK